LYAADNDYGLEIFTLADPANPALLGTYNTSGNSYAVHVSGNYAYVADGAAGLQIINISDPANPELSATLDTPNFANDIYVLGNYAYIADGSSGLQVIDISNPAAPAIIGAYDTGGYSYKIYLKDNYAYISDGSLGLQIINIENPANPSYAGIYETSDICRGIYVAGNYAYIASYAAGLEIISISAIQDISSFTPFDTSGYAYGVRAEGNYAYLADGVSGLEIFNVSDPENITLSGTCDTPDLARDLVISENYAYVADNTSGIQVINISNPANPEIIGSYNTSGSSYNIVISGNYGYVADGTSGLVILNISNPAAPSLAGSYNTSGTAYGVYVNGDYGYIADGTSGLVILNISNPAAPSLAGSCDTSGTAYDIYADGDYAYIADGNSGLKIIDISDPAHPALASSHFTPNTAYSVYISGNYAYMGASYAGPEIINVADPANPFFAAVLNTTSTSRDFYASGNYGYVADGAAGIRLISVGYYLTSGEFSSSVINTGQNNYSWGDISWTSFIPAGSEIILRAKTSDTATIENVESCASLGAINSANQTGFFSSLGNDCISSGDRYIKYNLTMTSPDDAHSPALQDFTFNFNYYPAEQTLTSSPYDVSAITGAIGSIAWTEEIPTGCDVKFKLKTAPDNDGVPGDWTEWMGPASADDFYTSASGADIINSLHADGLNDGWFQYKIFLYSNNITAPTADNITINYAANAAPEIQNAAASQNADGTVSIAYEVKDSDALSGTNTPGEITPSFEYWNGSSWVLCSAMGDGNTANKEALEDSFTSYSAVWNPKTDFNNNFLNNTAKIKITVSDNELANKFASLESNTFILDTTAPYAAGISVIASTTPAELILSASDDSAIYVKISLDENLAGAEWQDFSPSLSIALASNPDTVYAQLKDAVNNTSSIISATAPASTEDMIIRDVSNKNNSDFRIFIGWKNSPVENFKQYNIFYSTDGIDYALLSAIDNPALNYYVHQDLNDDLTYYYKVNVEDINENVSFFSDILSDCPDGQGGTDNTAPAISSVSSLDISATQAKIIWTTDELSNSSVLYSENSGEFTSEKNALSMVLSHSVILTSLSPHTTYYFKVQSIDPSGNIASSTANSAGYTFTTLTGPIISNILVSNLKNTGAVITWDTDTQSDSYAAYSPNFDFSDPIQVGSDTNTLTHSVSLTGLLSGIKYYFYVSSTDDGGGVGIDNNGGSYYNFTTSSDLTGPSITQISVNPITDEAAVITWITDEAATSKVEYGTASCAYINSSSLNENLDMTHSATLSSLSADTKYYYIAISKDGSGNTSTSTEQSFTTSEELSTETEVQGRESSAADNARQSSSGGGILIIDKTDKAAPIISNIETSEIKADSVKVFWETNEETKYNFVEFSPINAINISYRAYSPLESGKEHLISLEPLNPETDYTYKVLSADSSGNLSSSEENFFKTVATTTPADGIVLGESAEKEQEEKMDEDETNDSILIAAAKKAIELINKTASRVSISVLEETLSSQYDAIKNLAKIIPSPILSGEPKITVSADSAIILWNTDKEANSLVSFSEEKKFNPSAKNPYLETTGNSSEFIKEHAVILYNLKPETIYHYQIKSSSPLGQEAKSDDFTFTTKSEILEITDYSYETISKNQTVFRWKTNFEADSKIKYTPFKDNILAINEIRYKNDDKITLSHEVSIDDFQEGVIYEIELISRNMKGKTAVKTISSFSAGEDDSDPVIYQVQSESAILPGKNTKVQTIISWLTNEPSTSRIYYKEGIDIGDFQEKTALDSNYTKRHIAVITKFNPGKVYTFKVESMDYGKNTGLSKTFSILIPRQQESVMQIILKNLEKTFGWVGRIRK
ncbi:MAG: fibronectin type III domain-containing protein, partial [bacterium]